jgi:hypothetical protein
MPAVGYKDTKIRTEDRKTCCLADVKLMEGNLIFEYDTLWSPMESHREFQQLQMLNFYKFYYEIKKLMVDIKKKILIYFLIIRYANTANGKWYHSFSRNTRCLFQLFCSARFGEGGHFCLSRFVQLDWAWGFIKVNLWNVIL